MLGISKSASGGDVFNVGGHQVPLPLVMIVAVVLAGVLVMRARSKGGSVVAAGSPLSAAAANPSALDGYSTTDAYFQTLQQEIQTQADQLSQLVASIASAPPPAASTTPGTTTGPPTTSGGTTPGTSPPPPATTPPPTGPPPTAAPPPALIPAPQHLPGYPGVSLGGSPPLAYEASHPGATMLQWLQDPGGGGYVNSVTGIGYAADGLPAYGGGPPPVYPATGVAASVTPLPNYHGNVPPTVFPGVRAA